MERPQPSSHVPGAYSGDNDCEAKLCEFPPPVGRERTGFLSGVFEYLPNCLQRIRSRYARQNRNSPCPFGPLYGCGDPRRRTHSRRTATKFYGPFAQERVDELHLGRLMWATKADLLKSFANEKEAIDELILQACSSYPKARKRARELLERYFGITASMLPCVPCEP